MMNVVVVVVVVCAEDLSALKEKTLSLKEGVTYQLKIHFKVRRMDAAAEGWRGSLSIRGSQQALP